MGTPRFAVPILDALASQYKIAAVVTQPDRRAGRGRSQVVPSPVKERALELGLLVLQPSNLRDEAVVQTLHDLQPEVIVVAAFGQILRPSVLSLPPKGCINVHASLLPRHRGPAPIPAAILAGDRMTGVTIILMDEGVDSGPILSQATHSIGPRDTTGTLTASLAELGAELLLKTLPRWLAGEITPQPQSMEGITYAPIIRKSDGMVDWTLPAIEIDRRVRAYTPWPGAYTYWQGRVLRLVQVTPRAGESPALPGQVIRLKDGIGVGTGDGLVMLEIVQLAGKRAMDAEAFARGQRDFIGSRLG
ncbi:MAG: methionyl-tRNA formyltransferase [Chloroflexi bacterium]|nr:methionyl-tRNA formyltransferase [Chloroflexota bacterium]